jgi:uncharacterized integral membrane protein (TIGR00698 family)
VVNVAQGWRWAALAVGFAAAWVVPGWAALAAGLAVGLGLGNPDERRTRRWTKEGLAVCVALSGLGVRLEVAVDAGLQGVGLTALGLVGTLALGLALGRWLGVPERTATLLSVGTAICGGSAIAAVAPVIKARDEEVAISLATVFVLNAVGLVLFPTLGHALGLDEATFGRWAALALHDTSSVVGAARAYGPLALEVGTTTKLVRALWILPVALALAWWTKSDERPTVPWFIPAFAAAVGLVWAAPALAAPGAQVAAVARQGFGAVLFLLGAGVSRDDLRRAGAPALTHGVVLWVVAAAGGLWMVW